MARLVQIASGVSVNPDYVVSMAVSPPYTAAVVRMSDGVEHRIEPDFGNSIWDKARELRSSLSEGK